MAGAPVSSTCNQCDAPIEWALTPKGKWIPLDPEEDIFGTVAVNSFGPEPTCRFLQPGQEPWDTESLRVKHFDTCGKPRPQVPEPQPPVDLGPAYTEDKVDAEKLAWLNGLTDAQFLYAFIAYAPTPSAYLVARNLRLVEIARKLEARSDQEPVGVDPGGSGLHAQGQRILDPVLDPDDPDLDSDWLD